MTSYLPNRGQYEGTEVELNIAVITKLFQRRNKHRQNWSESQIRSFRQNSVEELHSEIIPYSLKGGIEQLID